MPDATKKTTLSDLLRKVTEILAEPGAQPGTDGFDAPSVTILHILKIFLLRSIEHVIDLRKGIGSIRDLLRDPAVPEGEAWMSDLPALRAKVAEMAQLLQEIVEAIKQAQAAAPEQPPQDAAPTTETSPTNKDAGDDVSQAALDELAAALSRGEKPDLVTSMEAAAGPPPPEPAPQPPLGRITPIKRPRGNSNTTGR